jgi:hypothetical protein
MDPKRLREPPNDNRQSYCPADHLNRNFGRTFETNDYVPPAFPIRLAMSTFTPGPIVEEIATRLR